jgi:ferredoxin-NADP reductase
VATHKIKLKSRTEVAFDTMAFHFEKPSHFKFIAGQAADFTLIDPPETDKEGNKRSFSLASAPFEEDLMVATRMRDSAFKRSLHTIPLGTELTLEAPWGELTLHDDLHIPAVLLTGGIGITAMRSIVLQAAHDKRPQKITLFYSNHKPEDTAFLSDLHHAQKENPHFKLIATMTRMHESIVPWNNKNGETGPIDEAMLAKSIEDLSRPIYYICGPPEMVEAMQKMLKDADIKAKNIRTENFDGY